MIYSHLEMVISKNTMDDLTYAIPEIQMMRVQASIEKTNELIAQSEKLI